MKLPKPFLLNVRRSGHGPLLVLLHGVAGSAAIWDQLLPELEQQFEVWRFDLLGYGYSPKPHISYTPTAHIASVRYTLQQLGAAPPYDIVGLSMGSILALSYAALYPAEVSGVVNLGLPYFRSEAEARRGLKVNLWTRLVLEFPLLAHIVIGILWRVGPHSEFMLTHFTPKIYSKQQSRESMYARYRSFSSSVKEIMVNYRIEPLLDQTRNLPLLFVHGSADQWSPAERLRLLVAPYANCRFELIEGAEHNLAVVAPLACARQIKAFLLD